MITNIDSLAEMLKGLKLNGKETTPKDFIEALKDENEHQIEVSKFYVESDIEQLKTNIKKEGYEEGKTAGSEMTIKDIKRKFGIEAEGKSVDVVYKHINEKVLEDAKLPLDDKIKELNLSLETLRGKYETDSSSWQQKEIQYQSEIKTAKNDSLLNNLMPSVEGYKKNHLLAGFKSDGFGIQTDENGNVIPIKNGKPLKDNLENYRKPEDVITDWLTDNGYNKTTGRGGGNNNGGGYKEFKTMDDVMKHLEKENINPTSEQGIKIINKFEESQV